MRRGSYWLQTGWKKMNKPRLFYGLALGVLVLMVAGFVTVLLMFVWFSRDLPSPNRIVRREGYASRMYDRNGEVLYDVFRDAKRRPVTWEALPEDLKKATVAIEDKNFYQHAGFDPLTPWRIAYNLLFKQRLIGGSTLTQQLVKNVLLTSERTVTRKMQEFILSVQIEAKYSKDEILLMYLNEAPYGGAAWGVGAATEQYFGKEVKDLTLVESVILSGLPQRPSVYSPFSKTPTAYVGRSQQVLESMVAEGMMSADKAKSVLEEVKNYKFYEAQDKMAAHHFVFWVRELLAEKYGDELVEEGGLQITTSLESKLQQETEKIVGEEIDKAEKLGVSNGAALVLDAKTGEVLAMVGSRGYFSDKTEGKFNVVTQGLRQPGSAIKPITYLTGLKKGLTPATMLIDAPVVFPSTSPGQKDYEPGNYTGKFVGPISLRNALGNSINVTAVKLLATVGLESMLAQAEAMGLTNLAPTKENLARFGLAVTLGGAEVKMIDLASAYTAFANQGVRSEPLGVLKVVDAKGRVLEENRRGESKSVMTPQEAFLISNILADNSARELTFGSVNGLIVPNYQVAVKTGTTNDKRDNWAIGWTPNLLAVAWVGNNDNSPMTKVASGVSGATPIWRRIMLSWLPRRQKEDFPIPEKIVSVEVDRLSGYPAHDGFAARPDYFVDGTHPKVSDPIHTKLKVCRGQIGLATPDDVATGNYDEKEYIKLRESDPVSSDGQNRWQAGIDKWIEGQPDKEKYYPPENYCRSGGLVNVAIDSPGHQATVGNDFEVKIKTTSLHKIVEVKLWINDVEKKVWTEKPYETSVHLENGKYTIKVRAVDRDGNSAERGADIGVNVPWDWTPSPTATVAPTQTVTPIPTLIPSLSPILSPTM